MTRPVMRHVCAKVEKREREGEKVKDRDREQREMGRNGEEERGRGREGEREREREREVSLRLSGCRLGFKGIPRWWRWEDGVRDKQLPSSSRAHH